MIISERTFTLHQHPCVSLTQTHSVNLPPYVSPSLYLFILLSQHFLSLPPKSPSSPPFFWSFLSLSLRSLSLFLATLLSPACHPLVAPAPLPHTRWYAGSLPYLLPPFISALQYLCVSHRQNRLCLCVCVHAHMCVCVLVTAVPPKQLDRNWDG